MRQRKRESYALHADELRSGDLLLPLAIARFLEDLIQSTHFLGFFEKQPNGFLEILEGLLLRAPAGGNIQLHRVSHVGAPFLENAGGELNLHSFENALHWKRSTQRAACEGIQ